MHMYLIMKHFLTAGPVGKGVSNKLFFCGIPNIVKPNFNEPYHEKNGFSPMRKQRRRSDVQ